MNRIYHTWDKWECYPAGFYEDKKDGMTREECEQEYKNFLSNNYRFEKALFRVITEWKNSCEHYLTNKAMNRIAYLGQAACCYALGIPAVFRGGFNLLTSEEQQKANETALTYLNKWLKANGRMEITLDEAMSFGRQSDIY